MKSWFTKQNHGNLVNIAILTGNICRAIFRICSCPLGLTAVVLNRIQIPSFSLPPFLKLSSFMYLHWSCSHCSRAVVQTYDATMSLNRSVPWIHVSCSSVYKKILQTQRQLQYCFPWVDIKICFRIKNKETSKIGGSASLKVLAATVSVSRKRWDLFLLVYDAYFLFYIFEVCSNINPLGLYPAFAAMNQGPWCPCISFLYPSVENNIVKSLWVLFLSYP